jgi:SAM-dependent methyltransferase
MTKYKEKIIDFYKVRGVTYLENTAGSVGWSSDEAQYKRFEILCNIGVTDKDTILDYGCGLGHLIDFLKERGFNNTEKNYFGIDILNPFVLGAKELYPDHKFQTAEIYEIKKQFDYVLGSGTFTISMPWDETLQAIRHVYGLINKGFAFNLMNNKHRLSGNEFFRTYTPEGVLETLQNEYNNIKIISDYAPDQDFTIYIYK